MSVNKYNSQTGQLTCLANGSRMWVGTKAAYEAAKQAGTLPNDCLIAITNDETDPFNFDDKEFVTTGLTYTNTEYFRGGYIKVGSLVFVDLSVRILTATDPRIQGFPASKDRFVAVPWVDNIGNYGTVRMMDGDIYLHDSGVKEYGVATITCTYIAESSE